MFIKKTYCIFNSILVFKIIFSNIYFSNIFNLSFNIFFSNVYSLYFFKHYFSFLDMFLGQKLNTHNLCFLEQKKRKNKQEILNLIKSDQI